MTKNKNRFREEGKEQRWRRLIGEWRVVGGTVRGFCRRRGLSEPSFYAWRRALAERDRRASAQRGRGVLARRDAATPAFIPVRVAAEEFDSLSEFDSSSANGTLDVVLSNQRVVRVRVGFDAATLRRLLAVLEEKPC